MGSVSPVVFSNVLLFLLVPFVFGYIFKRLHLPPIIGFILAGIVLGNFSHELATREIISNFASFGIILLMFTIGLEVNFEKIIPLKRYIVLGGLLQIFCTSILIALLSMLFHFASLQAMLIGLAFTSSSTSLIAKIIQERGEESSFVGELALGTLMFQDLAFIPLVIIFTTLTSQTTSVGYVITKVFWGIAEAGVILAIMVYGGKRLVPMLFDRVGRESVELLNLLIVIFIFFVGFVATSFHVPILIAVYVAGVLVSQTTEHHHIFSQIRPFRDLLATIFFIFIGTTIQVTNVVGLLPAIFLFSLLVILIKSFVLLGVFVYFRFNSRIAFTLALYLFQISESAFILLSLAYGNKIITSQEYLFLIATVLTTLTLTPFAINNKETLFTSIRSFLKKFAPPFATFIHTTLDTDRSPLDQLTIKNHVVICGYGRIGSHIGRALMLADVPFIAIDYNYHSVSKAKREGIPIIYGDPSDIDILDYAQLEHAVAVVIVVPDKYAQEAIILNAKRLNSRIYIISRVHKTEHQQRMRDLGAHIVVQPEVEASLSIIRKLFLIKKLSKEDIVKKLHHFKVTQGF